MIFGLVPNVRSVRRKVFKPHIHHLEIGKKKFFQQRLEPDRWLDQPRRPLVIFSDLAARYPRPPAIDPRSKTSASAAEKETRCQHLPFSGWWDQPDHPYSGANTGFRPLLSNGGLVIA